MPPLVETAQDVASRLCQGADKIVARAGVVRRHVSGPHDTVISLAIQASEQALGDGPPPDLILNASTTFHQLIPDNSVFIQKGLNIAGVPSFSVHGTCLSFLLALHVAEALLSKKAYRRVLICSAELASRSRNWNEPESAVLLGDGAGAVVVEWADADCGMLEFLMTTWPDGSDLAEIRGFGVGRPPNGSGTRPDDHLFHMEGRELVRMIRPKLVDLVNQILGRAGLARDDIDLVVPHQPSGPGLRLLQRLGFPKDRVVEIVEEYGNCVAASLPMALATAVVENRLFDGANVLLVGTSAGVSVAGMLLRW
ncbi:MAG: ketoacyl-ACP synthase III [Planctomycetota bacterium]|nr:ketoacyl-ACP synthase III [Planctomycetota bacterium]